MDNKEDSDEIKLLKALFGENYNSKNSAEENSVQKNSKELLTIPKIWEEIVSTTEIEALRIKLIQHFSVLADTEECQGILKDIIYNVEQVDIEDGRLVLSITTRSSEIGKLVCSVPQIDFSPNLPKSYIDILKIHSGYSFPGFGHEAFNSSLGGTAPVFLNGGEVFTMFEPSTPEEEEFTVVIDTHQDSFVLDPNIALSIEKPAVSFLSHASAEVKNLSQCYSIGGHYLRLIALTILGNEDPRLKALSFI